MNSLKKWRKSFAQRRNAGMVVVFGSLIFIAILSALLFGTGFATVTRLGSARGLGHSKQSYLAVNSAVSEAYYSLKRGILLSPTFSIDLGSASAEVQVSDTPGGKTITAEGLSNDYERNARMDVILGTGISFHYGIQSGQGGFELRNSSSVTGNVFSSGPIVGQGNMIYGDVISAGPAGIISNIHATGTAFAHRIIGSIIEKDAYYYNDITGTLVSGTSYPNSPDQVPAPLPIDDAQINEWEQQAQSSSIATCTNGSYDINSAQELGNVKIPCNLNINGTAGGFTVTISGPVWVKGNITTSQKTTIAMKPDLGVMNVAIIADDTDNPESGGIISLSNRSSFQGSGQPGSFVFMISQNRSAESGGSVNAISVGQSSDALVAYAAHGLISLAQSVSLKEATAYKITLSQSANVRYDTGLPNTLFSAGPGGDYDIQSWVEI